MGIVHEIRLTLLSRPNCHLCEEARQIIDGILLERATQGLLDANFEELSIEGDEVLTHHFNEDIPVVLINEHVHDILRVNPDRLRQALLAFDQPKEDA